MDVADALSAEDTHAHALRDVDAGIKFPNMSQEEIETMIEMPHDDLEEEVPVEKFVRQWPDLATARAERYRKEVNSIRERFHEEPEDDMNMCSEYADEIFQYMTELEVCWFGLIPGWRGLTSIVGGHDARLQLHGRPTGH